MSRHLMPGSEGRVTGARVEGARNIPTEALSELYQLLYLYLGISFHPLHCLVCTYQILDVRPLLSDVSAQRFGVTGTRTQPADMVSRGTCRHLAGWAPLCANRPLH